MPAAHTHEPVPHAVAILQAARILKNRKLENLMRIDEVPVYSFDMLVEKYKVRLLTRRTRPCVRACWRGVLHAAPTSQGAEGLGSGGAWLPPAVPARSPWRASWHCPVHPRCAQVNSIGYLKLDVEGSVLSQSAIPVHLRRGPVESRSQARALC